MGLFSGPLGSNGVFSILALALVLSLFLVFRPFSWRIRTPLPPGPPGEFILGHYRVVPVDAAFKQYAKWGKQYSKLVLSLLRETLPSRIMASARLIR